MSPSFFKTFEPNIWPQQNQIMTLKPCFFIYLNNSAEQKVFLLLLKSTCRLRFQLCTLTREPRMHEDNDQQQQRVRLRSKALLHLNMPQEVCLKSQQTLTLLLLQSYFEVKSEWSWVHPSRYFCKINCHCFGSFHPSEKHLFCSCVCGESHFPRKQ